MESILGQSDVQNRLPHRLLLGEVVTHLLQFFLLGANLVECLDLILVVVVQLLELMLGFVFTTLQGLNPNLVLFPLRCLVIELLYFSLELLRFLSPLLCDLLFLLKFIMVFDFDLV